ncbi:MAG: DNA polymerase III subunit delta' [Bacillota bacterium]
MLFSDIIGHKEVVLALRSALTDDRVGHAYLFLGPAGVGKKTLAREFAAGLLCPENGEGCGEDCQSCRRYYRNAHPDFITVVPSGNSIKIEQLRELQRQSYLRPLVGRRKVFFFPEAEQLTEVAANSFLKTLEEPPAGAVFLFTAVRAENILPTIRSRCQIYQLFPVSPKEISAWLKAKGYSEAEADRRAQECEGSPGAALEVKESPGAHQSISFADIIRLDLLDLFKLANDLEKRDRREVLVILQEWEAQLRINILQSAGSSGKSRTLPDLVFWAEKITRAMLMIENNVNLRLVLDEFFLETKAHANYSLG